MAITTTQWCNKAGAAQKSALAVTKECSFHLTAVQQLDPTEPSSCVSIRKSILFEGASRDRNHATALPKTYKPSESEFVCRQRQFTSAKSAKVVRMLVATD